VSDTPSSDEPSRATPASGNPAAGTPAPGSAAAAAAETAAAAPAAPAPGLLPPPTAPLPAPTRRGGFGWAWLVVLLLLLALGWAGWREYQRLQEDSRAAAAWRTPVAGLEERLLALEQQLAQSVDPLRRNQRAIEQRLDAATATNKLLREEVLAVAERAGLLEEAIARQAEQRLRGELLLKLNEAEFLLLMGAERLRLFGDVGATLEAYRLADATLASMDDPLAAGLRDTLAQELDALADLPRDPVRDARAALDAIAAALPRLPPRPAADADATGAEPSRLRALISSLVTVRRLGGDDGAVLDPLLREAGAAALVLDLATARAAAERADPRAYNAALMRAEQRVQALYDPAAPEVARVRQQLAATAAINLDPALPALGATLAELRTLRSARGGNLVPAAVDAERR